MRAAHQHGWVTVVLALAENRAGDGRWQRGSQRAVLPGGHRLGPSNAFLAHDGVGGRLGSAGQSEVDEAAAKAAREVQVVLAWQVVGQW
jgi:hypothetical protein